MVAAPSRRYLMIAAPVAFASACAPARQGARIVNVLSNTLAGLTEEEAAAGVREALTFGVSAAVRQVGVRNGYFRDGQIRIPLPNQLAEIQSDLRPYGLSGLLDDLEMQLNRGAEEAAPLARDIFVDAIQAMTVEDALGIVNGGPTSATDFFAAKTTGKLTGAFTPVLRRALGRAGAIKTFDRLANGIRAIPVAPQLARGAKRDLIQHGVAKGLDGLFYYVGQEEAAIRANPAKRTTELLKRVFG